MMTAFNCKNSTRSFLIVILLTAPAANSSGHNETSSSSRESKSNPREPRDQQGLNSDEGRTQDPCNTIFPTYLDEADSTETYFQPLSSPSDPVIHPPWPDIKGKSDRDSWDDNSVHEFELGSAKDAEVLPASWGAAPGGVGVYVEEQGGEYSVDFDAFKRQQQKRTNHKQRVFSGARMVRKAAGKS